MDCFRITSGYEFQLKYGKLWSEGSLTRPFPGGEQVRLKLVNGGSADGAWAGTKKAGRIEWLHDGVRATEPAALDAMFQRLTLVFDPQKKEGTPQLSGREDVRGSDCLRYRFTDANSGEVEEVWIDTQSGELRKLETHAPPAFQAVRPDVALVLWNEGSAEARNRAHQ